MDGNFVMGYSYVFIICVGIYYTLKENNHILGIGLIFIGISKLLDSIFGQNIFSNILDGLTCLLAALWIFKIVKRQKG